MLHAMRGIIFRGVGDVRCESVPDPRIEAGTDALVRVRLSAVCGSDLHVYHGRESGLDAGCVLGHEMVGEILETGGDVVGLRVGDRVVSPFTTNCGACFYCRAGLTCRCEQGQLLGWVQDGKGLHGAQAEVVRIPLASSTLVKIPDDVTEDRALLAADVLPTGFFCADQAGVGSGMAVAVIGLGPVGLCAVLAARERGASTILAIDPVAPRRELAARFGAQAAHPDEAVERVRQLSEGRGADAVLEVVGSPAASRLAYDLVRLGGRISAVGVHTENSFAFTPGEAYDKNIAYHAGRCPARHYMDELLPRLSGMSELDTLFTHRLPLDSGTEAYRLFDEKREGCIKLLLES